MKKRKTKWEPKKGDIVFVCYDGKAGRACAGKILERRGFAIKVKFKEWGEHKGNQFFENWFVRLEGGNFGGYLRVKDSLMKALVGTPGDWYSVFDSGECIKEWKDRMNKDYIQSLYEQLEEAKNY